ncbi:hypothetical protein Sru01_06660 [Sphaerisporangium rufum]|uniref:Uncharacterized protein n=1 Tax=Sphaerisporangium rufum TaxID=1381558 RepID=A0A919QX08_9ACTN|nr:hypothetical protein [Sphaerisporangium rufum]GII75684.1 hypothetical protein Sru01_06660 [Sphaerisporangium rufum]
MTKYGRDDLTWDQLTEAGLEVLLECARRGDLIAYGDLNSELERRTGIPGFDFNRPDERAALGHLLWLIVERNRPETGMMISALVIYKGASDPGPGFFGLAADLGLLPRRPSADEKDEFWTKQVTGLHAHYANGG